MSKKTSFTNLPQSLPLLAILGLSNSTDGDWGRIRALQFDGVRRYSLARIAANIVAALLVIQTFAGIIPPLILAGWFFVLSAAVILSMRFLVSSSFSRDSVPVRDVNRLSLGNLALGFIWAIPLLFFSPYGDMRDLISVWAISATLMAGSALLLSAVPLGTIALIGVIGLSGGYVFFMHDLYTTLAATLVLTVLLITFTLENSKAYLMFRLSEAGLSEKSEVVSLLLREFEESGADWLWQIDTSRRVTHVSPRFAFALGQEVGEIEGNSFLQLIAGETWETGNFPSSLHDLAERLKRRESFSNLLVRVSIKGVARWWELSASPKLDEHGAFIGFRGVGSDVTEQRESAERIAHMARFDTLTGLPNRLQVTEALGNAMSASEQWKGRCAFLMIDLDRFKAVNDTLGHLVGDRLLARVSHRLSSLMSENEMCGRLGGDEFAVVIKDARDSQYVSDLSKRIIDTLSRQYEVDQHTLYVGASIGSAIAPRDGRTVETLMRNADLALYRSKDEGGCQHHSYEPRLHMHAEERRLMEMALRKALDNNELYLNYQPVVSADSEQILGFEALLRWTNPQFGNVSPVKFIPIAEESRLIGPIGEWVLHEACKKAVAWPSTIKVAVNVSAEQLNDPNFVNSVITALSSSGLPPQRLELEVTESVFMREGTGAVGVLDQILSLGINLALDDFGTGYSSLGYLRKTRFTTIKIDRSFVQGAAKDAPESLAIIRAVVAMADSLGMSTTAEGAETELEVEIIKRLGCKKIQGYFYGRPMAAADADRLFASTKVASLG